MDGAIVMSKNEQFLVRIVEDYRAGRISRSEAAKLLGVSEKTVKADAKSSIFEFIEVVYNRQRLHSTLGYISPVVFEERAELSLSAV